VNKRLGADDATDSGLLPSSPAYPLAARLYPAATRLSDRPDDEPSAA